MFSCVKLLFQGFAMVYAWVIVLVAGGAGFVAYFSFYYLSRRLLRTPPGPTPWPIIGNLHLLGPFPHQTFAHLAHQYGPIFLIRLGSQPTLIISSPALAKEILFTKDKLFADRPPNGGSDLLFYPATLISLQYGHQCRNTRKLCTLNLFSSKSLQETKSVREEGVSEMLQAIQIHSKEGQVPLNLGIFLGHCMTNVVCLLLIGKKDTDLQIGDMPFRELLHKISALMGIPLIGDFIPYLGWLDFRTKTTMRAVHKLLDTFLQKIITEALTRRDYGQEAKPAHFLDVLLTLREDGELKDSDVKSILLDLIAGTETIIDTIEWIFAELLRHPRVLKKVRDEVDSIVDKSASDNLVDETDIANLTYMHAVIKETFRLHPGGPLLIPHMSRKASQVGGYDIPEKTRVIVNMWAIGRSPEVWGQNCDEFIPERFMEEERKNIDAAGQHFELIPFGAGRRMCVGMPLAMSMIQLMLANIVHTLDLQLPEGQNPKDMDMTERPAFTNRRAQPLIVVAKPRNSDLKE